MDTLLKRKGIFMKETKVICAFPACGKTHFFNNRTEDIVVLDSDSSLFSWIKRKKK